MVHASPKRVSVKIAQWALTKKLSSRGMHRIEYHNHVNCGDLVKSGAKDAF